MGLGRSFTCLVKAEKVAPPLPREINPLQLTHINLSSHGDNSPVTAGSTTESIDFETV